MFEFHFTCRAQPQPKRNAAHRGRWLALVALLSLLGACGGGGGGGGGGATQAPNVLPAADAGPLQNVLAGSLVTLDGSGSTDADGDALTYSWILASKPGGSQAVLNGANTPRPTFTADVAGSYLVTLVVNDGIGNGAAASVAVTASVVNAAPVANAGVGQSVLAGSQVLLDGSGSSDANGDSLSYLWTLTSKPGGSQAALNNATSVGLSFTADLAGTYVVTLVVNDGAVNSSPASITITASVANVLPVANAGPGRNAPTGSLVTLDGSGSSDANGDTLTYSWTLTSKPAGSQAALSGTSTAGPTFAADVAGSYVATLVVNDGMVTSTASTVTVTAITVTTIPSGTILTDTTWVSGLYLLDGEVSVAPTATLTISPGVTVAGKDLGSRLLVAGTVIAAGTPNNRVRFTSNPFVTSPAQFGGLTLSNSSTSQLQHVVIEHASSALKLDGISEIALRNVVFQNNGVAVTDTYGYQYMDVQHCTFINNHSAFAGIRTNGGVFAFNDFQNNTYVFEYGYYFGVVNINNNNFRGSNLVLRAPESGFGYGTVELTNNWWGTTDAAIIDTLIFDLSDLGTLQQIQYAPVLTGPAAAGAGT